MIERLKKESGYSLVEVLVSIIILTVAIIPMVSMFDTGLRSATTSGNYDKARALANSNLEAVKVMEISTVEALPTTSCPRPPESGSNLSCTISTERVNLNFTDDTASFQTAAGGDLLRVTVTVEWEASNSYTATGLVSR